MPVSYDLVREQVFFRRELQERVFWLINLRWIVGATALAACSAAWLTRFRLPLLPLAMISLCVLLCNGCFHLASMRLTPIQPVRLRLFIAFAHLQICTDLAALFLAIACTGEADSPLLILVVLHVVLAGILLSRTAAFSYGLSMVSLIGILHYFHHSTGVPGPDLMNLNAASSCLPFERMSWTWFRYAAFLTTIILSAYIITSVRVGLRTKARELLRVSKELDDTNTKLTSLYGVVKEMGAITELKNLLDVATSEAATIMGVKACSIKLLDEQNKYLEFASTHGLSQDYLAMGRLDVGKSPINRRIIEGNPYSTGSIEEKDQFQYPENIKKEKIASMLCLPIRGNKKVLGVFCVYGMERFRFQERDVEFFSLMSDLTGMAIERIKWDLTKSWFIAKVTHNLRSPLNSINSMIILLLNGYLGPLNEQQTETLRRCEIRIRIVSELVGDLLKLGRERTEMGRVKLHPLAPQSVLKPLIPLFQAQASRSGIALTFLISDDTPEIQAGEGLLEDLFTNLISNAIKYTPPGGRVHIALSAGESGDFSFAVSDSGIGIPEEDIPRLFSEFFRAANAKQVTEDGTGLGLSIVKEILDRLGGRILVRSKVAEGTVVSCSIPAFTDPDVPSPN